MGQYIIRPIRYNIIWLVLSCGKIFNKRKKEGIKVLNSALPVKVNKQLITDSMYVDGNIQSKTKEHVLKCSHASVQKGNWHFCWWDETLELVLVSRFWTWALPWLHGELEPVMDSAPPHLVCGQPRKHPWHRMSLFVLPTFSDWSSHLHLLPNQLGSPINGKSIHPSNKLLFSASCVPGTLPSVGQRNALNRHSPSLTEVTS